ncbi:hypothetical protein YPPY29_4040, partial [Yersinia pestis PY-29]
MNRLRPPTVLSRGAGGSPAP